MKILSSYRPRSSVDISYVNCKIYRHPTKASTQDLHSTYWNAAKSKSYWSTYQRFRPDTEVLFLQECRWFLFAKADWAEWLRASWAGMGKCVALAASYWCLTLCRWPPVPWCSSVGERGVVWLCKLMNDLAAAQERLFCEHLINLSHQYMCLGIGFNWCVTDRRLLQINQTRQSKPCVLFTDHLTAFSRARRYSSCDNKHSPPQAYHSWREALWSGNRPKN